ncbi:hypothetical protein TNCV_3064771 [Trichonephila clavipes]|nr:hypothetical protein TNCV_3064771 [Trichonephila clavipes]
MPVSSYIILIVIPKKFYARSFSCKDIWRKALLMSEITPIGFSLNLAKIAGTDSIKLFPVSKQSFNDRWLLILAEASKTGLIFIEDVADVSLMTGLCGR